MTISELIKKLEEYANEYGNEIPVRTFDLDRHLLDITEVELNQNCDGEIYVYIGSD